MISVDAFGCTSHYEHVPLSDLTFPALTQLLHFDLEDLAVLVETIIIYIMFIYIQNTHAYIIHTHI